MEISPILISLRTASVATFFTFIFGIFAAKLVLDIKSERIKAILDTIFTIPLVLPPTVIGFLLLLVFGVKRPIGRFLLEFMGIRIVFSWQATVLAAFVIAFPLMYRTAMGAFEQIDENLIMAARTLGMSESSIFFRIMLPLASPGILGGAILSFARSLGEFGATAMIAGNIENKTRTLPLAIYSEVAAGNMKQASYYVAVVLAISFIVILLMNYFGRKPIVKDK
ncbi:molybdate ABC transporter permease subunit [Soehngenia longivitae]|uniref:Molybdenum transport system permease n=1 Tax=Soehngenia longivitae TaxID=2562294 RepID=A0A4Z0D9Z6_9FIRM|nr:molybdate ABC transporter permease subunit [Soehngenia longivitae]TFZ41704.1 molybdate ABC transporter permease subunit [Soehngenia longivitae]